MTLQVGNIPIALTDRPQWVVWKTIRRDNKPTKVPFKCNGDGFAKANDPATWDTFAAACSAFQLGNYAGVGYEFSKDDPFVGVDLDGCRNPETGEVAQWAKDIIAELGTYAEVSPTKTGVKLFAIGKLPFKGGRKVELTDVPTMCDKTPAIEVYDHSRYFAVTGLRLKGVPKEPISTQDAIDEICDRFWPHNTSPVQQDWHSEDAIVERARKYVAKMPPAVSGQSGHNQTFRVACILCLGFALERGQAMAVLAEYNQTCNPPWSDHELEHKIDSALKQTGPRGYLTTVRPENWDRVEVPAYQPPKEVKQSRLSLLADGAREHLEKLRQGGTGLINTGLGDLDHALGGGLELGELVVLAARPSHGKSAVALQCAYAWTDAMMPTLFISEEMSRMALGKRMLQFASDIPQEHWLSNVETLEREISDFEKTRAPCYVAESCATAEAAVETIRSAVENQGVKAVIVDYVQLLSSPGRDRYTQITNTSIALRQIATECKIVLLALCQLNRAIESRPNWHPTMADIKDSGQIEQDADVVVFLCWPHRINSQEPPHKYRFYVGKNRNRAINASVVECRFDPSRQRIEQTRVEDMPNYCSEFGDEATPNAFYN